MKVLFLDFDGVINHPGTYARLAEKYKDLDKDGANFRESEWLEEKLVRRVGDLCLRLGLTISVVSTWRHRHGRTALRKMLRESGLPEAVRVDACVGLCSKGEAVSRYLRANKVECYVVVDDGPGELPDLSRLVKTDGALGLTKENEEQIARLFA